MTDLLEIARCTTVERRTCALQKRSYNTSCFASIRRLRDVYPISFR
jgi:hypothetical protein